MKSLNVSSAVRTVQSVITANSPILLVGTSIAGIVATGVLAARGGYKARGMVDVAQAEKGRPLTNQEKFQLTWMCYSAPVFAGASTIASVFGIHLIHSKRNAALAALYAATTSKLDDYRAEAEELLGPKKTQELQNRMAQMEAEQHPLNEKELIVTGDGTDLYQEGFTHRWFTSSMQHIEKCLGLVNVQLATEHDGVSVNEFFDMLGMDATQMGQRFGWNYGERVEAKYGSVRLPDGRVANSVWFHPEPKDQLGKL